MHPHRSLRLLGATLAVLVAGIHGFHPQLGLPRFLIHLQVGTLFDPRPLLFTLSSLAILVGIVLVHRGVFVRYVYLGGVALMLTYIVGFAAWHTVLDHGAFWPHLPGQPHDELGFFESFVAHFTVNPVEFLSKLTELALLVVLGLLYRIDVLDAADSAAEEGSTATVDRKEVT